jgi:uncharacterized protein
MKLDLNTLAEGSKVLCFEVKPLELGTDPNLPEIKEPVRVNLTVFRTDSRILIEGTLETVAIMACSRCLEPALVKVQGEIRYDYRSRGEETPSNGGEEIASGELDVEWYEGLEIDLNDTVRQSLILSLPMQPLCSEQCRGLCPKCGTNLNLGKCQCREDDDSKPFWKLKGLKID